MPEAVITPASTGIRAFSKTAQADIADTPALTVETPPENTLSIRKQPQTQPMTALLRSSLGKNPPQTLISITAATAFIAPASGALRQPSVISAMSENIAFGEESSIVAKSISPQPTRSR